MTAVRSRPRPGNDPGRGAALTAAGATRPEDRIVARDRRGFAVDLRARSVDQQAVGRTVRQVEQVEGRGPIAPQETIGPRLRVHPRRRVSGRLLLLASAGLFFLVLAGSVTIQAQRIEAQHRIDRLDQKLVAADDLHRELRAEVAVAESPERIMGAAKDLGMVEPGPVLPLVPVVADPGAESAPTAVRPAPSASEPVALGVTRTARDDKVLTGGG